MTGSTLDSISVKRETQGILDFSNELYDELRRLIRGTVIRQTDSDFVSRTTLFNGNVKSIAKAVVLPVDAQDISSIVKFCAKHAISPSIKAGGYGTGGWAIAGDIMIDLSKLDSISMEEPLPDGGFVHMREMPLADPTQRQSGEPSEEKAEDGHASGKAKGKAKDTSFSTALPVEVGNKRERSPEDELELLLRVAPSGSRLVAGFLSGSEVSDRADVDLPRPVNRRRLDQIEKTDTLNESSTLLQSDSAISASHNSAPTAQVVSTPQISSATESIHRHNSSIISNDPFGYLSTPPQSNETLRKNPQIVSNDPFGYLSAPSHPAYLPPSYQQSQGRLSSFPAPAAGSSTGSNRVFLNSSTTIRQNPPSGMASSITNPKHPYAYVTFGAGQKMRGIDSFTASNPLPATDFNGEPCEAAYHVPMAAHPVGSSVMLLGGFGFLSRLHGLSVDNLVEAEIVLADGSIIIANKDENIDLFWALRGAGSAFGIVTRYKAKMYPVPVVFAGNLIYKFNASTAPSLVKHFRDCIKAAPRELYANVLFTAGPVGKDAVVVIQICYIGPREKGQEYLDAISSWDGERCLLNEVNEKSFLHQQDSVAQILRGKAGRQWYIRSALITSLPDDVIHQTVSLFADAPTGCTWLFELAGGAVADFDDTCFPAKHREATFTIAALHQWDIGVDDPRCVAVAEDWIDKTLGPVSAGGPYPCFLGRNENPTRAIASFGENWDRLCALKRKYDPFGLFKNTFWPVDIHGEPIAARTHEPPSP